METFSDIQSENEPAEMKSPLVTKKNRRLQVSKLCIIAFVAAAITVYTIFDIASAAKIHNEKVNLREKLEKKIATAFLIHHLQNERGLTAWIHSLDGFTKNETRQKDLIECRRKVNECIVSLKGWSSTVIRSRRSFLKIIKQFRSEVDNIEKTVSVERQLNTYSRWIDELMAWLPSYIASERFEDYSGWVYSYLMITRTKEEAGLERVLGGLYFLKGNNFTSANILWYNEKRIRKNTFLEAALSFSDTVNDIYNNFLIAPKNESSFIKIIEAKRKILVSGEPFNASQEAAEEWFDLMTKYNDILLALQRRVSTFVTKSLDNEVTLAIKSLIHPLLLLFFTLLLVPGLLFSLMRVQNAYYKYTLTLDEKVDLEQGRTQFLMTENSRHVDDLISRWKIFSRNPKNTTNEHRGYEEASNDGKL